MLSVLLTAALLPLPQSPENTVFETLSVQNLCAAHNPITPPIWGSMLTYPSLEGDDGRRPDLLEVRNEGNLLQPDSIVDLLHHLHTAAFDDGSLRIESRDADLLVFGDTNTITKVREELRELGLVVTRPLQIEVALWAAGSTPLAQGILGPTEYAQFAEQHRMLWRSRAETTNSRPVALDQQRWTRYLRDVDVEVAQKAKIANPVTDAFSEGGRVVVVPHTLAGGDDLVLYTQFGLAERRGEVAHVATGVPEQPDLEIPTLETVYGACSGHIQNGGALAITMTGAAGSGGNRILTIRATSKVPPATANLQGLGIYPISALCSQGLTQMLTPPDPYPVIGDRKPVAEEITNESPGYGAMTADALLYLLESALGSDVGENFQMREQGGFLFVFAEATRLARIEAVLRSLQERCLRTVTIHHQGRLAASPGGAESAGILHNLTFPTLIGRYGTLCRQLETNIVRDCYSEIAQDAATTNPEVAGLQFGNWVRVRTSPLEPLVHLDLQAQSAQGEVPAIRRLSPAGALMPPSVASTRAAHNGAIANGRPIDHGDGPIVRNDGALCRSDLVTIVTW